MIQHEIDHDAGEGDVHPDGQSPTSDFFVTLKSLF